MIHSAEQLANLMSLDETLFKTQVAQTEFRMRIAESWQIKPGMKLLEIGCGQGDMTLVLANAVGDAGHITAVDIAPPSYGAPMTLKQATSKIKASPLGARIDFAFNFNALDPAKTFKADQFDAIVLANSSWYFESLDEFTRLLLKIRTWSPTLETIEFSKLLSGNSPLPVYAVVATRNC